MERAAIDSTHTAPSSTACDALLQRGLAAGARGSAALSVALAGVVMMVMTRSVRAAALAALALLAIVGAVAGLLVRGLGWRLGIIEVRFSCLLRSVAFRFVRVRLVCWSWTVRSFGLHPQRTSYPPLTREGIPTRLRKCGVPCTRERASVAGFGDVAPRAASRV
jgi:hypothetical protein